MKVVAEHASESLVAAVENGGVGSRGWGGHRVLLRLETRELGDLISMLEHASGRTVDLVVLDEAPPAVAYRVFRDGSALVVKDRAALVARKTRAILEYLDFRPIEELAARGAIAAAAHGR